MIVTPTRVPSDATDNFFNAETRGGRSSRAIKRKYSGLGRGALMDGSVTVPEELVLGAVIRTVLRAYTRI